MRATKARAWSQATCWRTALRVCPRLRSQARALAISGRRRWQPAGRLRRLECDPLYGRHKHQQRAADPLHVVRRQLARAARTWRRVKATCGGETPPRRRRLSHDGPRRHTEPHRCECVRSCFTPLSSHWNSSASAARSCGVPESLCAARPHLTSPCSTPTCDSCQFSENRRAGRQRRINATCPMNHFAPELTAILRPSRRRLCASTQLINRQPHVHALRRVHIVRIKGTAELAPALGTVVRGPTSKTRHQSGRKLDPGKQAASACDPRVRIGQRHPLLRYLSVASRSKLYMSNSRDVRSVKRSTWLRRLLPD